MNRHGHAKAASSQLTDLGSNSRWPARRLCCSSGRAPTCLAFAIDLRHLTSIAVRRCRNGHRLHRCSIGAAALALRRRVKLRPIVNVKIRPRRPSTRPPRPIAVTDEASLAISLDSPTRQRTGSAHMSSHLSRPRFNAAVLRFGRICEFQRAGNADCGSECCYECSQCIVLCLTNKWDSPSRGRD